DKPGRAIVDLSQRLDTPFAQTRTDHHDEAIFSPHEIKGLERATVLIYGLNDQFLRAMALCDETENSNLAKFEARRLFDEMRVALSRSTDKLILFEAPEAPVLGELEIAEIDGVLTIRWDDLLESLQTEEMSEIEVIEGYLDEADELVERGRWQQARTRNRRAFSLALQVEDLALQRDAQEQYIRSYLHEATHRLHENQWQRAFDLHQTARKLSDQFGDPLLQEEMEDHFVEIRARIAQEIAAHVAAAQAASTNDWPLPRPASAAKSAPTSGDHGGRRPASGRDGRTPGRHRLAVGAPPGQ
ncbi:MAG: hypothetical protein HC802_17855, partial [Caldilineaceae bacterium]|nr:hypothetical protein [Caldilineaceae bacterium]